MSLNHLPSATLFGLLMLAGALAESGTAQSWSRAYRDPVNLTESHAIRSSPDGNFVVAANIDAQYPTLISLDADGNVEWDYRYARVLLHRGARFFDVQVTSRRDLVAVGHNDSLPFFVLADGRSGQLQTAFTTTTRRGSLLSATPTPDGGFVSSGWIDSPSGGSDLLVVSVDKDGQLRWQQSTRIDGGDEFGDSIVPIGPDFLILGRTSSFGAGSTSLLIAYVNAFGNTIWQRSVGTAGLDGTFGTPRASVAPDGSFFVTAGRNYQGDPSDDLWLLKLSTTGTVLWERVYDFAVDAPRSVAATPDDGCVLLGETTQPGSSDSDLWLLKLDPLGNVEWERRLGGTATDVAIGVDLTTDGGYIVSGATRSFGIAPTPGSWLWTLRLDAQGQIGQSCTTISSIASRNGMLRTGTIFGPTPQTEVISDTPIRQPYIDGPVDPIEDFQCATNSGRWTDLGNGMAGRAGVPELAGVGTLRPGEDLSIIVNGARPGAPAVLVLGPTTVYAPILGITLVPSPAVLLNDPAVPASGQRVYTFTWPIGIPVGTELVMQYLVIDSVAPQGCRGLQRRARAKLTCRIPERHSDVIMAPPRQAQRAFRVAGRRSPS